MYNKKKYFFENYWLESAKVNLKFGQQSPFVSLNNGGVYSYKNAWLDYGEITDRALQRYGGKSKTSLSRLAGKIRVFFNKAIDSYNNLSERHFQQYCQKNHLAIYHEHQQRSAQIMNTLARIKARSKIRCEEAGIKDGDQTNIMADETVKIALRAALKQRK